MIPLQNWNEALHAVTVYAREVSPRSEGLMAVVEGSRKKLQVEGRKGPILEAGIDRIIATARKCVPDEVGGYSCLVGSGDANIGNNLYGSVFEFWREPAGLTMGVRAALTGEDEYHLESLLAERLGKIRGLRSCGIEATFRSSEDMRGLRDIFEQRERLIFPGHGYSRVMNITPSPPFLGVYLYSDPKAPIFDAAFHQQMQEVVRRLEEALR